jgi:hypothetical protein
MLKCSERLQCAFCGRPTDDDPRYLELEIVAEHGDDVQWLGSHFACLQDRTDVEIVPGSY